jgi:hypothetical protein
MPLSFGYEIFNNPYKKLKSDYILQIDCNQTNGILRNYGHINCGPHPIYNIENGVDLSNQYNEIGIDFVRTHDFYGPTDISNIFPDFNADPNIESNYNFTSSDKIINSIVAGGFKIFYRLGESASDNATFRQPPNNYTKWAEICKHIIMHYNEGWKNGYFYNILYWEIWNEPDLNGFWNGSTEEYFKLYNITSKILKNYNSNLKIGGPCTSSIFNEEFTNYFLYFVKENNLPLDFYSWHMYANTPSDLYEGSIYVRNLLDEYGFYECENINTEWNINILTPQRDKDNANNAAFTASSLIYFQDAKIDYSFRYRGTQDDNWLGRLIGFDLSLFTLNGTYKNPALSYLAYNYCTIDTPKRINTPPMNSTYGIPYLAGISNDKSNISFIISNFQGEDTSFLINFSNIPWNTKYNITHYIIDDSKHFEIINQEISESSIFNYNFTIKKSSIHFLRLSNSSIIPNEGPNVADIPFILKLRLLDPFTRILGIILMLIIFG